MFPKTKKQDLINLTEKSKVDFSFVNSLDVQFQEGLKLHQSGNLAQAKLIYDELNEIESDRFEILHFLGTLEAQMGNHSRAIELLKKAITINSSISDTFSNLGNALIEIEDFASAVVCYDHSIALNANRPNDFCNRGIALLQLKQFNDSIESFNTAINLNPNLASAHLNLGNCLIQQGQFEQAIKSYEKSISLNSKNPICYFNIGLAFVNLQKYHEAIAKFEITIGLMPDFDLAYLCKGDALFELNEKKQAVSYYQKSISLNPNRHEAHFNIGIVELELRNYQNAIHFFNNAVNLNPKFADAYAGIGVAHLTSCNYMEAINSLTKAIEINSNDPGFYLNRSNAFAELRKYDEAFADLDKAIEIKSDYYHAYSNRGHILLAHLNRPEAALVMFEVAIGLKPDFLEAIINRAEALNRIGELEKARDSFLQALEIDSNAPYMIGKCIHYKMKLCDWTNISEGLSIYKSMLENNLPATVPFEALNFTDDPDLHCKSAQLHIDSKYRTNLNHGDIPKRAPNEKLRIGYYSADLFYHPASIWLAEQLENHDKSKIELYAFCTRSIIDPMRLRLEAAFDQWIDVTMMSDLDIVDLSRKLKIDIAIDLNGHTAAGRTGIFASRAAPIQLNYLGYPGTMGAQYYDYVILNTPTQEENIQSWRPYMMESVAYVPCGSTYDRQRSLSEEVLSRDQFGLPENVFVFTCQNGCQKLLPEVFGIWMDILKAVPDSVLWLLKPNDTALKNLINEAEKQGVESKRLIFSAREVVLNHEEKKRVGRYLASYKLADLFLDTWPYNAGTTAVDALWAGLPVLTKSGNALSARMADSALRAIEVPELITFTNNEYLKLAIELANNVEKLNSIKDKLKRNRLTTKLFDPVGNTRHIENAYFEMYRRYQEGLNPEDFVIYPSDSISSSNGN